MSRRACEGGRYSTWRGMLVALFAKVVVDCAGILLDPVKLEIGGAEPGSVDTCALESKSSSRNAPGLAGRYPALDVKELFPIP